jgi:malonyl-CoA O-methyltransferase
VVEALVKKITDTPQCIFDLGCGSGAVHKAVTWQPKKFVGVDFAEGMLDVHPKCGSTELHVGDFNQKDFMEKFADYRFDRVVSSSALQWADDLDDLFRQITLLNSPVSLAIFTSGTFKSLFETASIAPLLRSKEEVIALAEKHFQAEYEVLNYALEFATVREMFRYIKKSGVGGGRNLLGFRQMKELMRSYPLDYLEFEVVLLHEEHCMRADLAV